MLATTIQSKCKYKILIGNGLKPSYITLKMSLLGTSVIHNTCYKARHFW